MNKTKIKAWPPIVSSLFFALAVPALPILINFLVWQGSFLSFYILEAYTLKSDLTLHITALATTAFFFLIFITSPKINKKKLISKYSNSEIYNIFSKTLLTSFTILTTTLILLTFSPLIKSQENLIQEIIKYLYLSSLLFFFISLATSILYILASTKYKSKSSRRFILFYTTSTFILLISLNFFFEKCTPASTCPQCILLNILYIFFVTGATFILFDHFAIKKSKALESSVTFTWIVIFVFITINYLKPEDFNVYSPLMNTIFLPIALGFTINTIYFVIINNQKQRIYFFLNKKHRKNKRGVFESFLDKTMYPILFFTIIIPSALIHLIILHFFKIERIKPHPIQKKSRLVSRLSSRKEK